MNKRHLTSAILAAFSCTSIASPQVSKIAVTEMQLEPTGDIGENDLFGGTVAISANGKTLVVSVQGANSAFAQELFLYSSTSTIPGCKLPVSYPTTPSLKTISGMRSPSAKTGTPSPSAPTARADPQ